METLGELLGKVLPLAVGAAISPVVITLQVLTLASNRYPLRRTWAVAAGCTLVTIGWTAVALLATNRTSAAHTGRPSTTSGVLALSFAVLLVGLGVRSLLHRTESDDPKPPREGDQPRMLAFFAIGLGVMVTNFTSFLLFFPVVHAIGISDADESTRAIALALVFVITLLPAYAPPLVATMLGHRAQRGLDRLGRFVTVHRATINATICFAFAIYLSIRGVDILG